jgi:hypothetical protein
MNMTGISAAERTQPGELVRLLCDGLTASGLEARPLRGDGSRLVITCPRARCLLTVSDCGLAEWECCPLPGCPPDPGQVADLATALLTGRAGVFPRLGCGYGMPDLTLKGVVGLELKARGLDVELEVYEDRAHFDARSLIVVTSSAAADPATVQVSDDGCVTWTCDYWDDPATPAWDPDGVLIPSPAEVAAAVVATVTAALAQASGVSSEVRS